MLQDNLLKELDEAKKIIKKLEKKVKLYSNQNIVCSILDKLNIDSITLVPVELERHHIYSVEYDAISGIINIYKV